jgi:hypothetical protein
MATLPKVLINRADYQIGGGVALRLRTQGGSDRDRELETPVQYDQAPRITRLQTTSTRGVRARARRVAGCATSTSSADHAGAQTNLELTFRLDHPAGADQGQQETIRGPAFERGSIAPQPCIR